VHSSEENFNNPFYGRLTFLALPESNALTDPDGYMTNNLEVDNRGYVLAVDRNGAGFDIIELKGKAKKIGLGTDKGTKEDDDDD
jgi:hypothetical protein